MAKIRYAVILMRPEKRQTIDRCNAIIAEYQAQGFQLTLRQLYYQNVARSFIANNDKEYDKLGQAMNDGRMTGLVDWNAIIDRTRNIQSQPHWSSPSSIIESAAAGYHIDKWEGQPRRVEVWVEKDALIGVLEGVCSDLDVPYIACRGYMSVSEMWSASMRMRQYDRNGQKPLIIHLGDHDPSGIDMSRDIEERLTTLRVDQPEIRRIALNYDQVEQYNPPPNPAKLSDSRAADYVRRFGDDSWELDALEPSVIADLIRTEVISVRDEDIWREHLDREQEGITELEDISKRWEDVVRWIADNP